MFRLLELPAWKQAWRSLRRRPAFFSAAVLTLGLGTGITTAVFSLVDTVLIKPLPYPDAGQLVTVYESSPSSREKTSLIAPARLEDWQRRTTTFAALSGNYAENVTDTSGSEPERLEGRRVTPRFFAVYAMPPLAGRVFSAGEEQPNGPGAAVLSESFWTRRFARDPAAIGRALIIGGRTYEIVGVMPAAFTGANTDVWLPAQLGPHFERLREARFLGGIGRLRPGVSAADGARDLAAIQQSLAQEFPRTDAGWAAEITPLKQARVGSSRRGLMLVFGAVLALWVIAVANIAGLTLVQLHRRTRELAIRAAIGASRARVVGTVIREGAVVGIAGGMLGGGIAAAFVSAMPALLTATPRIGELTLDWRAMAFTVLTSLIAICTCSVVPALAGTRGQLNHVMGSGSRGVASGRHALQRTLVVAQVALSVLLVGSATLLLGSYYKLTHVETGFDSSGVITFHVGARWDEDRTRIRQIQEQLLARLAELPHVQAAGYTNFLPATGARLRYQVRVDGLAGPNADGSMTVGTRMIGGGYLRALRARLVAGAWCPALVAPKEPHRVLVNQRFVDVHAPAQNLVGRTLRLGMQSGTSPSTIVGVVGNVFEDGPAITPVPYVYTCDAAGSWPDPEYVARTSDARAFAVDLRRIVREIDAGRAVFGLKPLQSVMEAALDQPRLDAAMLGLFASAAVTLAAIGLYSLFMLVVAGRAREIAVRLAVGAAPREMMRLIAVDAGRLVGGGLLLGLLVTAAADRVLRGAVFEVSPLDVRALVAAAVILAFVCAIAVAAPAIRAARIAPIEALKVE